MKLYKKYLDEGRMRPSDYYALSDLKVEVTSDEEYAQAIDDIRDDLKGLARRSSSDRKRMLRDIQSTIKDLLKYRG